MLSPNIKTRHARINRQCKHKDENPKKNQDERLNIKNTVREMKKAFYGLVSRVDIK